MNPCYCPKCCRSVTEGGTCESNCDCGDGCPKYVKDGWFCVGRYPIRGKGCFCPIVADPRATCQPSWTQVGWKCPYTRGGRFQIESVIYYELPHMTHACTARGCHCGYVHMFISADARVVRAVCGSCSPRELQKYSRKK